MGVPEELASPYSLPTEKEEGSVRLMLSIPENKLHANEHTPLTIRTRTGNFI